jgi:hypothetical protein
LVLLAAPLPYGGAMFSRLILAAAFCAALHTPVLAQERQWSLDTADNQAFLTFGIQESEDVGLSLWCEIGKSQMAIFMPEPTVALREGESLPIVVAVDGVEKTLRGQAAREAGNGQMTVEAKFGLRDILISRLIQAQTISVRVKGHVRNFPFAEADFPALLSTCKGDSAQ